MFTSVWFIHCLMPRGYWYKMLSLDLLNFNLKLWLFWDKKLIMRTMLQLDLLCMSILKTVNGFSTYYLADSSFTYFILQSTVDCIQFSYTRFLEGDWYIILSYNVWVHVSVSVCVLERAKHVIFALPDNCLITLCSVTNKLCLNQYHDCFN